MRAFAFVLAAVAGLFMASKADAAIVVRIDKSSQTMRVIVDGEHRFTWAVSTGRAGYNTPNGSYRPQRLERHWRSRKYGMAPMPHSIFFRGGYAIHGTNMVGRLGRTDSHGCIRLAPGNARTLFEMVARQRGATRIVIEGVSPQRPTAPAMAARRRATRVAAVPARTTQMRLVQPATARAVTPNAIRTAYPAGVSRVALPQGQARVAIPQGQVRAAIPQGQIRAVQPNTIRTAYPAGNSRVGSSQGQTRAAYTASRGSSAQPAYRPADPNRFFSDWFMRR
jgi:hypothetical protein